MFSPRWYQEDSVKSVWEFLCSQAGNPIIVLPTGAGKSLCIAMLCRDAIEKFQGRVIILAHRKELLRQNEDKIRDLLPTHDIGVYSAGLNSRDTDHSIILAGIQSSYNKAFLFGRRNLVIIDESHLVPSDGEGMYRTFFLELGQINPTFRAVGLTATPFRTGEGKVCKPNSLFQKIVYDAPVKTLIEQGYLCNLLTNPAEATVDTSGLHIRAGEFINSEMNQLFDDSKKIESACLEIIAKTQGRNSLLVFCSGVFHANKIALKLEEITGEECGVVTRDTPSLERAATLGRFKNGFLKRLCNVDVLTTGFDSPGIDAIAILRATMSPGLFAQMVGRGLRVSPLKQDCLILDFGENLKRHGPIDSADFGDLKKRRDRNGKEIEEKKSEEEEETDNRKECPACGELVEPAAKFCPCGWKFPDSQMIARHGAKAGDLPIFQSDIKPTKWLVETVGFSKHIKRKAEPGTPATLRVDYGCIPCESSNETVCYYCLKEFASTDGIVVVESGPHKRELRCPSCGTHVQWVHKTGNLQYEKISEWVCLDHTGYAKTKALKWWSKRSKAECGSVDEALSLWKRGAVASPVWITTKPDGNFKKITGYGLDERPDEWREETEIDAAFDAFDEIEVPF